MMVVSRRGPFDRERNTNWSAREFFTNCLSEPTECDVSLTYSLNILTIKLLSFHLARETTHLTSWKRISDAKRAFLSESSCRNWLVGRQRYADRVIAELVEDVEGGLLSSG
jgi:hypothetical protein